MFGWYIALGMPSPYSPAPSSMVILTGKRFPSPVLERLEADTGNDRVLGWLKCVVVVVIEVRLAL